MELYDGQRPPKAGLFFKTSNRDTLNKMWDEAKQRAEENPHLPIIMGVPDSSSGRNFVEFIDFMKSLDELQHTEMRNEYRRQIGAVYGVEPLFQGDVSQGGGLNNEGMQVTVTNRAVEYGQEIYNKFYLPKLLKAMGVKGYVLTLNPSEEQDEMAKLERQRLTLENGRNAVSMGLEAKYIEDTSEVFIKEGDLIPTQAPQDDSMLSSTTPQTIDTAGEPEAFDFQEAVKQAKSRPAFTKLADTLKLKIQKFLKKFKRRPKEAELQKIIAKVNLDLQSELKASAQRLFKKTYTTEMDKIGKDLGVNVLFDVRDQNALNVLANQQVLSDAYKNLSADITNKLNLVIQNAFRNPAGLTALAITGKIRDIVDVSDFRAETIARTETSKVASAARKMSYQKEEDFDNLLFKHIGPNDNRTTNTSKRIKARTKSGVVWSDYVGIVKDEASKDFPDWTVNEDFPVSHYNSRHTFVRLPTTRIQKKRQDLLKKQREIEEKEIEVKSELAEKELDILIKEKTVSILKKKEKVLNQLEEDIHG